MPLPSSPRRPAVDVPGALRRARALLASRTGQQLVVGLNVVVLVLAIAPFAIWEGFGPARFDDVELGRHPDPVDLDPGEPLAMPGASDPDAWSAADLPYDLSPTTTVTLVFSVGSRDLTDEEAARLRVHDVGDRGGDGLTDTMMLVVADRATREVALLSIPRDLWVDHRGHRINATFNRAGLQAFVDDVARAVGLPIHHLVRLNFGAFARLVDAIGGVALHVDRPLADVPAVLYVPDAGCWHLDGPAALAWARGRHTLTRDDDGDWVTDRSASDFGRIERQQALLGAIWDQVRSPGSIAAVPELLTVARDGLVVDDGLGVQQVRDLLAVFGEVAAGEVEGHTLPTTGQRIGGAAAQVVDPSRATEVLTRMRTWPPSTAAPAPAAAAWAGTTVLAAPRRLALPGPASCTREQARALPDPRPALWGVAASRGEAGGPGADATPSARGDASPDAGAPGEPAATPDGSAPSDAPEPTGSPSADPSPTPSSSPTPSPSPSETDDGLQLPWPGWGSSGG